MLAIALAATLALRASAGVGVGAGGQAAADAVSPERAVARALVEFLGSLAWLVEKSLWPWPQSNFVPDASLPPAWAGMLALVALAALGAWALSRWLGRRDGLPGFALLWFAGTCAPALAAAVLGVAETTMAERFLYLPSVAVALAAGAGAAALAARGRAKTVVAAAAVATVALGVATVQRGLVWNDNLSLWTDAVAKAPDEGLPLNELAVAWAVEGDVERAFGLWQQARGLRNTGENAATIEANLGNYWLRKRDFPRAREHFEAAVRGHWALPNAQRGLARLLVLEARSLPPGPASAPAARELLERARVHFGAAVAAVSTDVSARIEFADALLGLAGAAQATGDPEAATQARAAGRDQLDRALALDPSALSRPGVRELAARLGLDVPA